MNRLPYLLCLLAALQLTPVRGTGKDLLEDFWEDTGFYDFRVSPGGRFVSYRERDKLVSKLHVRDFQEDAGYSLKSERDSAFGSYTWVDGETIALEELVDIRDVDSQMPRSYISVFNYKLRQQNANYNRPSRLSMEKSHRDIFPQILSGVPAREGILLIEEPSSSFWSDSGRVRLDYNKARSIVHRLDTRSGKLDTVVSEPIHDRWIADSKGMVRMAMDYFGERGVFYRSTEADEWRRLPFENPEDTFPIDFLPGDQLVLVCHLPEGGDKYVVQAYNPEQRKWASKPVEDPVYDIVRDGGESPATIRDQNTGNIIGIVYDREKPEYIWFDPSYAQVQKVLQNSFPGAVIGIKGLVKPINSVLVTVHSDRINGEVLLFDLESHQLTRFMATEPQLDGYQFNEIRPVDFKARDGATIYGYVTLPAGYKEGGPPPPMVVAVKGGPMTRHTWAEGIDFFEDQWLSRMGFAVLNVNYRGSTGYGQAYEGQSTLFAAEKGVEDVVDGTRWAIENGFADPSRIVLMGASFGGYVSAMAPAAAPDLYTITIPAMGVYDWLAMIDFDREESHPFIWDQLKERYGDYEANAGLYRKWSPAENADKIRIPMLLLHGVGDQRVDIDQVKIFESALDRAGVDYRSDHYTRGGHGFGDQKGWLSYYEPIEEFIREHIELP